MSKGPSAFFIVKNAKMFEQALQFLFPHAESIKQSRTNCSVEGLYLKLGHYIQTFCIILPPKSKTEPNKIKLLLSAINLWYLDTL